MDVRLFLAAFAVLAVLTVSLWLLNRIGAGAGARLVNCPHKHQRAKISAFWTTEHGRTSCDILQCSLLPGGKPVTCDKGCIAQLQM